MDNFSLLSHLGIGLDLRVNIEEVTKGDENLLDLLLSATAA